jgi:hypothetical protein
MITKRRVATGLLTAAAGLWPTEAARAEVAEVALAYQFGIRYTTYNPVADPEVTYSIIPSGLIKFTVGVMKSKPNSWKDLVFPELHGEPGS